MNVALTGEALARRCRIPLGISRKVTRPALRTAARARRPQTMDQYIDLLGLPSDGALRASVGLASNVDDVERLLAFVQATYTDRAADTTGLAPRRAARPPILTGRRARTPPPAAARRPSVPGGHRRPRPPRGPAGSR